MALNEKNPQLMLYYCFAVGKERTYDEELERITTPNVRDSIHDAVVDMLNRYTIEEREAFIKAMCFHDDAIKPCFYFVKFIARTPIATKNVSESSRYLQYGTSAGSYARHITVYTMTNFGMAMGSKHVKDWNFTYVEAERTGEAGARGLFSTNIKVVT